MIPACLIAALNPPTREVARYVIEQRLGRDFPDPLPPDLETAVSLLAAMIEEAPNE